MFSAPLLGLGESDSTFMLFCPWPLPHGGPCNTWHRLPFPPLRELLISAHCYVKCFHVCSCVEWAGGSEDCSCRASDCHGPSPTKSTADTGTCSLTLLVRDSHILPLTPTAKLFPQPATIFHPEAISSTCWQYYSHFTD